MIENSLQVILPAISLAMSMAIAAGLFFGFRSSKGSQALTTQKEIIEALEKQVTLLKQEVGDLKKTLDAFRKALAHEGLRLEVDGDVVVLTDERAKQGRRVQVRIDSAPLPTEDGGDVK